MPVCSPARIVILDYGTGNLNSIKRMLDRIRVDSAISSIACDVTHADKLILPGVGHFDTAMRNLRELGLIDALHEAVLVRSIPVLGICLGMQIMARESEEGTSRGLGWLDARNTRLSPEVGSRFKVPHMGWNGIAIKKDSTLMNGIDVSSEFYFAHSFHLRLDDPADVLAETEYGTSFASAIERENIFGVQFHPEKSHDAGARLLRNFAEM